LSFSPLYRRERVERAPLISFPPLLTRQPEKEALIYELQPTPKSSLLWRERGRWSSFLPFSCSASLLKLARETAICPLPPINFLSFPGIVKFSVKGWTSPLFWWKKQALCQPPLFPWLVRDRYETSPGTSPAPPPFSGDGRCGTGTPR